MFSSSCKPVCYTPTIKAGWTSLNSSNMFLCHVEGNVSLVESFTTAIFVGDTPKWLSVWFQGIRWWIGRTYSQIGDLCPRENKLQFRKGWLGSQKINLQCVDYVFVFGITFSSFEGINVTTKIYWCFWAVFGKERRLSCGNLSMPTNSKVSVTRSSKRLVCLYWLSFLAQLTPLATVAYTSLSIFGQ